MAKSKIEERVEAVIISGPRKGELITLANGAEPQLTPAEETALDLALEAARRAAESAVALSATMNSFNNDLKRINTKHHGLSGKSVGVGDAAVDNRLTVEKRRSKSSGESKPNGSRTRQAATAGAAAAFDGQ